MLSIIALLLTIAAGVGAFTMRTVQARAAVAHSMAPPAFAGGLPGAGGPELRNFDPLKFSDKSPDRVGSVFQRSRTKALGWIVADFVHLPGDVHAVSSLQAHNVAVQSGAMVQILLWTSLLEIIALPALKDLSTGERDPGNFFFDPLGLGKMSKDMERYKVSELKNGRLAMLAFSGIVTQSALYDKALFWLGIPM